MAHFTQFAQPGWHFLGGVGRRLPQGGGAVGFVSPDGNGFSVVVETTEAKGDQTLALRVPGLPMPLPLHVWRTDQMEQFIPQPDLAASNGTWAARLNPI